MNKILILIVLCTCFTAIVVAQSNQTVSSGTLTNPASFPGGCSYTWTNDNPAIGLPATGTGNIPAFTAVNNGSTPITATITARPQPGGFVYVSNTYAQTVSVISIADNSVIQTIPVQFNPMGITLTADGKRAFVVNSMSRTVSEISTSNNGVISNMFIDDYTISICVTKDGSKLYVANYNNKTVSVYNTASKTLIATIPAGLGPYHMCLSPDESRLYITNDNFPHANPSTITVINTLSNSFVATIAVGSKPEGITVNKDGSRLYVANMNSNSVSVINAVTNTVTETISVGNAPQGVVLSPDEKILYTKDGLTNQLWATNLLTKSVNVMPVTGLGSKGMGINSDGSLVYIINTASDNVSVINTISNTEVAVIPVQRAPDVNGNFLYDPAQTCSEYTFTITVNPSPTLTIGPLTGNITACAGSTSATTQQFEVSGTYLTGNVTISRSGIFGFSTSDGGGGGSGSLVPVNGTLAPTIVYVGTSGTTAGYKTGTIGLSSPGMATQYVNVSAFIDVQPRADALPNLKFKSGAIVGQINFLGTADQYRWENSNPGIGLVADGKGKHISAFTATNNSAMPMVATIAVIPVNDTRCEGVPIYFTITVENDPELIVGAMSGTINGCFGTSSTANQQFQLSGRNLKGGVTVNAPAGFLVSTSSSGGYADKVDLQAVNGLLASLVIYVRSAANAAVGVNSGNIVISTIGADDELVIVSSTVNVTPVVNAVANQQLDTKNATYPINFTGTADQYLWTNSAPAIGLAASGIGNIGAFTVVNTSNSPVIATITVIPSNNSGCQGTPVLFSITINPENRPGIIIPNIFTPNGDGVNDTWAIQNINFHPNTVVKVFNRLGAVVFSSQGYPQPWDGRRGTNNLPTGTYYYLIDTNDKKVFSGYLSIIR
jgi:gliding motility-associated-like protein